MANRYAVKSGSWQDASVWSATSGGAGGAGVPTASDAVYLNNIAYDVTINGTANALIINLTAGTLNLNGYTLNTSGISASGSTFKGLTLNGTLNITGSFATGAAGAGLLVISGSNLTLDSTNSLININAIANPSVPTLHCRFDTNGKTFNDVFINLGAGTTNAVNLDMTGLPTFRALIIQSKNSAAHTVSFDSSAIVIADKFVAIGSASTNRLTLGSGVYSALNMNGNGTVYGQYVNIDGLSANGDPSVPHYIGSNSIETYSVGSQPWLIQDPPKISTLADPLTIAPASNTNWTVTGTISQITSGRSGGGYSIPNTASLVSTGTYDLVGSQLIFERPNGSGLRGFFGIDSLGGYSQDKYTQTIGSRSLSPSREGSWIGQYGYSGGFLNDLFTYPLSSSKYIRLRIDSNTLKVAYSSDGASWTEPTASFNLDDSQIALLRSVRVVSAPLPSETGSQYVGSVNPDLNTPPTTSLSSPSDGEVLTTTTPALTFSATDPNSDSVTYQVQISTDTTFATTHEDKLSAIDTGFSSTDPYASGVGVTYTVQASLTQGGITYYWRVRAKDPSGSNTWGAWTVTRSMVTEAIAPTVTTGSSSAITTTTATTGGNVTSDGGATVTERGVVYATTANPTTIDSKKTASGTTGAFTVNLASLTSNTTYHYRAYATNSKGTSYGADQTFSTLPIPPTVATGTASGSSTSSLTVSGSGVTSNPDSQTISEYGVVYSTSQNPTTADSKQTGTGTSASFANTLTSLSENTTYYIRAYAIWGTGDTAYGSQTSYKTQGRPSTILDSPAASGTAAVTKPQLKFTGTDPDSNTITYELQLNTTNTFTTPLLDTLSASDTGFSNLSTAKTDPFYSGNQIGYTLQTDLSRGADYYWRVRGKDTNGSNTWGNWTVSRKFTVQALSPSITVSTVHDVTFDSAQVDASVTADNGASVTERGIVYSTTTGPTTSDSKVLSGTGTGSFTATLPGLTGSTKYYARAYAINSAGTSYSSEVSFTTLQTPSAPTVVTGTAANITDITSEFNDSEVTLDGTATVTERGIVFSDTNTTPTTADRKIIASTSGLGTFNIGMTGLEPSTVYHVRAYAINSIGTGYGSTVDFTTEAPFVPDEGDGHWTWSPDGSDAVISRDQATDAYSSANLMLEDLNLEDGTDYTLYYSGSETDNGTLSMVLEWYEGATKTQQVITPGTPYTFTYDSSFIHWAIRLFVTGATAEVSNINATFNDLYLAKESSFSGFVEFIPKGITEVKLENNWLLDKRRETTIDTLFNAIKGISWYPFDIDTEGLGWFEIGDRFTIRDDQEDKSVVLWNSKLTVDGGMKENLFTKTPDKTQTDYSKAGKLNGLWKTTKVEVDKNKQTIDSLVSDMYDLGGVVNTKFSEVQQDVDSVKTTVQSSGGVNLIKNSVMYAFDDDGVPDKWVVGGTGTLTIQASPESISAGGISGNIFALSGETVSQTVAVRKDVDFIPADQKQYYSFSARVKKNVVGTASITLSNRNETHTIDLPDQTEYYWEPIRLEGLLPLDDHFDIEITSDTDANLQVTDVMLSPGENSRQWTQANGEAMNTSVQTTDDGVTVRSNIFRNDYTKIDALGFEVHKHEAGGERVFGFNGDETNASKLKVDNQISMVPLKTVPINYGTYKGWAFVRTED